jgi:hypothetical protein
MAYTNDTLRSAWALADLATNPLISCAAYMAMIKPRR